MKFDPRLSGLRGLAASGVVVEHVANMEGWQIGNAYWGMTGIEAFLALSMFLLLRTLDQDSSPRRYFRRRILRIWPAYFATCFAVFFLFDHNPAHLAGNLTFVALWVPSLQFSFLPWAAHFVLWTLQLEEMVYITIPLIHRLTRPRQELLAVGLFSASAAYGALTVLSFSLLPGAASWTVNAYGLPPIWLAAYGAGILGYTGRIGWLQGQSRSAYLPTALLVPLFIVCPWPFYILATSPLVAALIVAPPAWLARLPLLFVGESSYAMYLTHALWLGELGLLGTPFILPAAFLVELASRPRALLARLRAARREVVARGSVLASPSPLRT